MHFLKRTLKGVSVISYLTLDQVADNFGRMEPNTADKVAAYAALITALRLIPENEIGADACFEQTLSPDDYRHNHVRLSASADCVRLVESETNFPSRGRTFYRRGIRRDELSAELAAAVSVLTEPQGQAR